MLKNIGSGVYIIFEIIQDIIEELMNRWHVENQSSIVFFCEESVDLYCILSIYIWFVS